MVIEHTDIDSFVLKCASRPFQPTSQFDTKLIKETPSILLRNLLRPKFTGSHSIEEELYMLLAIKAIHDFECKSGVIVTSRNAILITIYALLMLVKFLTEDHYADINRIWANALSIKLAYFNQLEAVFLFKARFCIPYAYTEARAFVREFEFESDCSDKIEAMELCQ